MTRKNKFSSVLCHFGSRRFARALCQNPHYLYELPWMLRSVTNWSAHVLTDDFHNNHNLQTFIGEHQGLEKIVFGIHGYFSGRGHFHHYAEIFSHYGIGFFAPQYGTFRDIRTNARYLGTHVKSILRGTSATIVLLGHSLGCLVALELYYNRLNQDEKNRISHLFLLAGPHHGTPLAEYGYGKSAEQMCVGSDYINYWQEKYPSLSDGEKLNSFFAPRDALVSRDNAMLPIPNANNLCVTLLGASSRTTHVSLLYDPTIASSLAEMIENKSY